MGAQVGRQAHKDAGRRAGSDARKAQKCMKLVHGNVARLPSNKTASPFPECGRVSISAIYCPRKLLEKVATGTRAEYHSQLDNGGF